MDIDSCKVKINTGIQKKPAERPRLAIYIMVDGGADGDAKLHPQPLLMELQVDYLTQAMELIGRTKDYPEESRYRWTIEANCVLEKWLCENINWLNSE